MARRIAAYSHDTVGLGHLRRTLTITRHLGARRPDLNSLIISGSPFVQAMGSYDRIDFLKLPAAKKIRNGHYEARYLGLDFDHFNRFRSGVIDEGLRAFEPDLLIIDKTPGGMNGELLPCLRRLRETGARTRVVLGLRDILDEAPNQRAEWTATGDWQTLDELYDAIWIYGSADVFNPVTEYGFSDTMAARTSFLGYLPKYNGIRPVEAIRAELDAKDQPLLVLSPGGGEDGYELLSLFLEARDGGFLPTGHLPVLVTGPGMPEARVAELRHRLGANGRLLEFSDHFTSILAAADLVITMGGYNTLTEALCLGKRVVSVPRVRPRREQWIRAQRFAERGLLTMVEPDGASPATLGAAIRHELGRDVSTGCLPLDFGGLERLDDEYARLFDNEMPALQSESGATR